MSKYIYGRNPVMEVLKNGNVDKIYIQKGDLKGSIKKIYSIAMEQKILITYADKKKLDILSENNNHQGVVALTSEYKYYEFDELLNDKSLKKIIILDKIEDPRNFGAIARSAETAGFDAMLISKHNSSYVTETVYKSSAGAIENIKVSIVNNIVNSINKLKENDFWIFGAQMDGEIYDEVDLLGKIAIVIGNEGKGISQTVQKACDKIISIPLLGKTQSLNASCAASILMFEVIRQERAVK